MTEHEIKRAFSDRLCVLLSDGWAVDVSSDKKRTSCPSEIQLVRKNDSVVLYNHVRKQTESVFFHDKLVNVDTVVWSFYEDYYDYDGRLTFTSDTHYYAIPGTLYFVRWFDFSDAIAKHMSRTSAISIPSFDMHSDRAYELGASLVRKRIGNKRVPLAKDVHNVYSFMGERFVIVEERGHGYTWFSCYNVSSKDSKPIYKTKKVPVTEKAKAKAV